MNMQDRLLEYVDARIRNVKAIKKDHDGDKSFMINQDCRLAELDRIKNIIQFAYRKEDEDSDKTKPKIHDFITQIIWSIAEEYAGKRAGEYKMLQTMAQVGLDITDNDILDYAKESFEEIYQERKSETYPPGPSPYSPEMQYEVNGELRGIFAHMRKPK